MQWTFLAPEEHAYPNGRQTRKCRAFCYDGKIHTVWGGIPDTFFTIPAHAKFGGKYHRGYLSIQTNSEKPNYGELVFYSYTMKA